MVMLQIRNLKVSYGRLLSHTVLNIQEFDIACGELVAFYGPNHAGKTTFLKVLAGTLRDLHVHSTAKVLYDGKPLPEFGPTKVAYLPQRFADTLFPWMSLRQNLRLRLMSSNATDGEQGEIVLKLCNAMGFETEDALYAHFGFVDNGGHKRPAQLSGGQQQILALLRALLPTPAVLVLDEPFSAIDSYKGATLRKSILKFLDDNKITTVMVTHDLEEAVDLADRIIVLNRDGKGSTIDRTYEISAPQSRSRLSDTDAAELVQRIKSDNGIG